MDEALCLPGPDRFWESTWAISGPDKEIRGEPGLLVLLLRWQKSFKMWWIFSGRQPLCTKLKNNNVICFAPFKYRINTFECISTDTTRNIYALDLDGKGTTLLSLWPPDCAADYQNRNLGLSPYLPVQEMSSIWFVIGTISSQSDITGVMAEVMETRWWGDGDEPLLSLFSLHHSFMWFSFGPLLILSGRLLGFILLCRCHQNVFLLPSVSNTVAID